MWRTSALYLLLTSVLTAQLRLDNVIKNDEFKIKDIVTDKGLVRGYKAEDGEYFAFFGIPYAASPTGTNRFKVTLLCFSF